MNLERITVEFHAEEDRLMVRVFFGQKAEIQFWLTRRLVKRIWPVLVSKVRARRNDRGQTVLSPQLHQGNGVDPALGDTLLHGPMKRVQDTAVEADWDILLAVPTFMHAPAEEDSGRTVN